MRQLRPTNIPNISCPRKAVWERCQLDRSETSDPTSIPRGCWQANTRHEAGWFPVFRYHRRRGKANPSFAL